ncbi:MAG TPA: ubiquinol oxidase subunit II [Casimicrobiaceae bacterium]|jgi:cytochrome o ubiquinol oxidase subunit 2|nr:ubiquinol oxidase subunit II [Casimicrobiaceae bacterium]
MVSSRAIGYLLVLSLSCTMLAGCDMVLLRPSGYVAAQQGHLVVLSTLLMLLIVVPVIALTLVFAWHYRESNAAARYTPEWDHSIQLELLIWSAPLLIIIGLGALTWIGTHTLDPYRSLTRIDAKRPVPDDVEPLNIEVVALDWKWLFIYPDQNIAVMNELAAPVDAPIHFKITASSVMNSFFVPALAGQIYAMPGMATSLNAVINRPGEYEGFSANYSGAGFSAMRFKFLGMSPADFDGWVQKAKAGAELSRGSYMQLEQPSEREPVRRYGGVAPDLFDAIVNRCVDQGKMCLREMMAMDEHRPSGGRPARESIALNLGLDAAVCKADNSAAGDLLPSVYRD